MKDMFWQNLRYTFVSLGTGLIVKYAGTVFSADQAASLSEGVVGAVCLIGAIGWGNYVKWRTRAVPEKTAARADVPTVSAATGAIEH
jgi:hypothetical protein